MSIYQCEKCGCKENTALGHYHSRSRPEYFKWEHEEDKGKALCSACGPSEYSDGSGTTKCGKWHNRFDRAFYPLDSLYTDREGNVRFKDTDEYATAEKAIRIEPRDKNASNKREAKSIHL